eukprot:TRINITY_DN64051_c0_g1_i1.p1 TRINITY_DN64051_c0_g1~~TRINITY_DN64051_c0_g1_i1.p1  ORF type:complete len:382 (+),score=44.95 TRINITY_DN64051_c0_g1_i1:138-1148(+)
MPVNADCRGHADLIWSALLLRDFDESPGAGYTAASHYACVRRWRSHAEKSVKEIRQLPAKDADAVFSYMARREYYPLKEEIPDSDDELVMAGYWEPETKNDQDILRAACTDGLVQTMQVLIDKRVSLYGGRMYMTCPLLTACSHGRLEILKMILVAAPDIDVNGDGGSRLGGSKTALHAAASKGHLSIVQHLSKEVRGILVDARNHNQETPLHEACYHGHLDVVRFLFEEMGADVHTLDRFGKSCLHKASFRGHPDVVKYLLTIPGIDVNQRDQHRISPYAIAQLYLESHPNSSYKDVVAILQAVPGIDLTPHPESGRRGGGRGGRGRGGYQGPAA